MIRPIYCFLLRLHPLRFRERFGDEMLEVFDTAVAAYGPIPLLGDGIVSLARQWFLRPHKPVNSLRLTSSQTPCFHLIEHETLRPSAQIAGAFSAILLLATVQFALRHWSHPMQTMGGILRTSQNQPSFSQIQVATTALTDKRPEFEVVSITAASPNHPDGSITVGMAPAASSPGRIRYPIINSRWLVSTAYGVPAAQVEGPDWMNTDYFEVNAAFPINTPPDQVQVMLQNLLADRFGLKIHREVRTRQAPTFNLLVTKSGPRLKVSKALPPGTPILRERQLPQPSRPLDKDENGFLVLPPPPANAKFLEYSEHVNRLHIRVAGHRQTMTELAATLGGRVRGTVTDATKLSGEYDYELVYSKEDLPPPDSLPDIFDAVQSQLGLKLQKTGTTPIDAVFVVVDHMERQPTEN